MLIYVAPREVQRQVELAFLLEATFPKEGCTSRYKDAGPNQRFEDFLVSAVNSGRYFYRLAKRIVDEGKQPYNIYFQAYAALLDSTRGRTGKYVSYGLLEAMLPVVAAKCLFGKDGSETLGLVKEVLANTSKEDVWMIAAMRELVYSNSNKEFKRNFPFHDEGNTVLEHYEHHRTVAHEASSLFVTELISGMPLTKMMNGILTEDSGSLEERIGRAFNSACAATRMPRGAVADFMAAALYLMIADDYERPWVDPDRTGRLSR